MKQMKADPITILTFWFAFLWQKITLSMYFLSCKQLVLLQSWLISAPFLFMIVFLRKGFSSEWV